MKKLKIRWLFYAMCVSVTVQGNPFSSSTHEVNFYQQDPIQVRGVVKSTDGQILSGTTIRFETGEVSTDKNGEFNIKMETPGNLVFSAIGFNPFQVYVRQDTVLNVVLESEESVLEEVVVIGYGSVKRKDLTGAVSSVKSEDITRAPVTNPIEALQGRIAGVDIARESGKANSGSSILLRGNRSLTAGNAPLYIIDGIPGSITNLNPNDIESIDILKDAASTAIYGSAGANGVFIVTTKKAKEGRVAINFDAYAGVNSNGKYPSAFQGNQWLQYLEDAFIATNDRPSNDRDELLTAWNLNPERLNGYIDQEKWVNWVDETLQTGVQQNYALSVKGGTDKTQGYFSLGYNSTKGIYRSDQSDLFTSRAGATTKIGEWFEGGIVSGLSWRDNETRPSRLNKNFDMAPLGEVYDADGNINVFPIPGMENPSLLADDIPHTLRQNSKQLEVNVNPYIDVDITRGLSFRSILGATLNNRRTGEFNSDRTYMMLAGSTTPIRNGSYSTGLGYKYVWENILNYNTKIGKHHDLSATLVSSWADNQNEESFAYSEGFLYDEYEFFSLQGGTKAQVQSRYYTSKRMSVASRLNYGYKGKYLLTLTHRTDGVSQLAKRWDTFLAAAGAWRVIDEEFMQGSRDFFSDLKLRVSYGVSGNSGISPYSTLTEVTSSGLDQINLGGGVLPVAVLTQAVGNPDLSWEKSYNFNIGLDFGLLNNRLTGSLELYDTDTRDVLYARDLPFSSGGFTPKSPYQMTANLARLNNKGIELTLTGNNLLNGDAFQWNSTLTYAYNKEQVRSIDLGSGVSVDDLVSLGLFMNRPSNTVYDYNKIGIWQQDEALDAAVFGLRPGDVKVQSRLERVKEGVWIDPSSEDPVEYTSDNPYSISPDDRMVIGQGSPKWTAGWQNTFTYKGLDLSVFTIARWGHHIDADLLGYFGYKSINMPSVYNYWTPENPTNDFPRPYINRTSNHSNPTSGLRIVDASFIKIKNISLGYSLPESIAKGLKMSNCRVYATMYNPLIFTKSHLLKDMDPETGATDSFPLYRQMVFGVNLSF